MTRHEVERVLACLDAEADPAIREQMADRYGIRAAQAYGIPMRRLKAIAKPLTGDHDLALALWASGSYEARTIAAFVDDPARVTVAQMDGWVADFDNWAIVDTVCFHLFDRTAPRWSRLEPWSTDEALYVRRAAFALLWALALHDRDAPDARFVDALALVERCASDERPHVTKALVMALRAIGTKRPEVRPHVVSLARRLADRADRAPRRVGRPILRAFA